jgi:hypothetical protein
MDATDATDSSSHTKLRGKDLLEGEFYVRISSLPSAEHPDWVTDLPPHLRQRLAGTEAGKASLEGLVSSFRCTKGQDRMKKNIRESVEIDELCRGSEGRAVPQGSRSSQMDHRDTGIIIWSCRLLP